MNHYDNELNTYADSGLRTAEDWASHGRGIEAGAKPRVDALQRGVKVALFSRNQTHVVRSARDDRQAPAIALKE